MDTVRTIVRFAAEAVVIVAALIAYFTPTIVAKRRAIRQLAPVIVVNVFLGWTFVGWVVALAWAVSRDAESP